MAQAKTRGPDWPTIQRRWIGGEKSYSISKALGGSPTAHGITKRADREGWERADTDTDSVAFLVPCEGWPKELAHTDKFTEERGRRIITAIADGMPYGVAGPMAGIGRDALYAWRKASPAFQAACNEAMAHNACRHIGNVADASDRGELRASEIMLRGNPLTRHEYAGGQGHGAQMPTVQVVLQVPEPGQPMRDITPPSPVIEGES